MVSAGVAVVDITPPAGLTMAGFGVRTEGAVGAHDALTGRAIVVEDTAIVVADVLGLDLAMSTRIRARCGLPPDNVVVAATHTHGGPATLPGRAGGQVDAAYLARLEQGCVEAIVQAARNRRPVRVLAGVGADPQVGRNRRHADGPVDPATPVLRLQGEDGRDVAVLLAYACHPVTLGPDNLRWTGDYVHFVREAVETAVPGAVAVFLTGCCGDVNTGHSAAASMALTVTSERSFATAARLGQRIAAAALAAELRETEGAVRVRHVIVPLPFERRERDPRALAVGWREEHAIADAARRVLLEHWIHWAETVACVENPAPWPGRVSVLEWAGVSLAALPGEIFAATALELRALRPEAFVVSCCDSFPGYLPPRGEYRFGGYEVEEAHRFIGTPGGFAPGCAEALAEKVKHFFSEEKKQKTFHSWDRASPESPGSNE